MLLQGKANLGVHRAISQLDDLPNFRQIALNYIQDPQVNVTNSLTEVTQCYPKIPNLQHAKKSDMKSICACNPDLIRNQQNKYCDIMTILGKLHLDYAREIQGLTLNFDQQLKSQIHIFRIQQKRSIRKTGDRTTRFTYK